MDVRGDANAVVAGDGELVIEDPTGGVGPWLSTQVRGEGVKVSHVAVS